eukprot:368710_1
MCQDTLGTLFKRSTICFKCHNSFCQRHASEKRWNSNAKPKPKPMQICDKCLNMRSEQRIRISIRLKNLRLKNRMDGTYINKIDSNCVEYKMYGLRKSTKIIKIGDKNVEMFDAQLIANTLNTIDIPFELTIGFNECQSQDIQNNHIAVHKSIGLGLGFGAPISDKSIHRIIHNLPKDHSIQSQSDQTTLLKDLTVLRNTICAFNTKYDAYELHTMCTGHDIQHELNHLNAATDVFNNTMNGMQQFKTSNKVHKDV